MAGKKTDLRHRLKEATAQEILEAAEIELAAHGLAATSMNAIAARAGVSVGTLYNYYKDKEVLLATLLQDRRERFTTQVEAAITAHKLLPFAEQLEAVVRAILEAFDMHRDYLRVVLENEKPVQRKKSGPTVTPGMWMIERLRTLTAKGVEDGVLAKDDAHLYPAILSSLIRGVMIDGLAGSKRSFVEGTPVVVKFFLGGARKGAANEPRG